MDAVSELAHERGVSSLTVGDIATRTRISRVGFYKLFDDKDDCLRFSCQEAEKRVFDPVRATLGEPRPWSEQVSDTIAVFLAETVTAPLLAELCLIHSISVEGNCGSCVDAGAEALQAALKGGRTAGRELRGADYCDPPPRIEELLARGFLFVVASHLRSGRVDTIGDLHAEMVHLCALHFLGDEPDRELARANAT
ncbi:MAG: hypothetical protein QOE75_1358 [Solirubrobacterales bacterium]|jgi:AcrR family transcriptional regulator|nr:hypothetical protein [Solirubrobacterales bacterium]